MKPTSDALRDLFPFFKATSPELLDQIVSSLSVRHYRKGSLILLEGNSGEEIFFVASGLVGVATIHKSKRVMLGILGPGEYFGEMALVRPGLARSATVETLAPTVLYALRKSEFDLLLAQDRGVLHHLLLCALQRLDAANQQIFDISFLSVRSRIAKRLLALFERYSGGTASAEASIPLKITHQQLADMVGAARETVSKILQELCDEELIIIRQKMIRINDPDLLRKQLEAET